MSRLFPDDQVCEAYRRTRQSVPRDLAGHPASLELTARYGRPGARA
jgi:hypothetical protein